MKFSIYSIIPLVLSLLLNHQYAKILHPRRKNNPLLQKLSKISADQLKDKGSEGVGGENEQNENPQSLNTMGYLDRTSSSAQRLDLNQSYNENTPSQVAAGYGNNLDASSDRNLEIESTHKDSAVYDPNDKARALGNNISAEALSAGLPHYIPPFNDQSKVSQAAADIAVDAVTHHKNRKKFNPLRIEKSNLDREYKHVYSLESKLGKLLHSFEHISSDIKSAVEDRYAKVLQLNN